MAYKTILTVATDPGGLAPVLQAAGLLARAQDGHLDVLVGSADMAQPAFHGYGDSMAVIQITLDHARAQAAETEAAVREILTGQDPALRWSVETEGAQYGSLRGLVAQYAMFSDLVLSAQPYGKGAAPGVETALEAALFDGRAPVLVIPRNAQLVSELGQNIVIGWDQSREAMTAVRRSLPLLQAARQVSVVVVDPPVNGVERSDPGGRLCHMLVRHGIRAEVAVLARTEPRVSDVLLRHVRDQGADLLVMGAYGHSRLREAIVGGATRDLLERSPVPIFLAH